MSKTREKRDVLHIIGNVIGILMCLVLVPMLAVNITLIVKSYMHPEQVPDFLGYKPFIVLSGSMEPSIMTGDLIVSGKADAANLQVGDVVSYRVDNAVVTHRIKEVVQENGSVHYVMQGDNNNTADETMVTPEMVEGTYLFRVKGMGNFAMFMQTTTGMLLFIVGPLALFIIYDMVRRRLGEQKEKSRTAELEAELARLKAGNNG